MFAKGKSVCFCMQQSSAKFVLLLKGQRTHFGTARAKFLLWLKLEFVTILNTSFLLEDYR